MAPFEIVISREAEGWPEGLETLAERAIRQALEEAGDRLAGPAELSIVLLDDAAQQALNAQWRGIGKPTNVLSFPGIAPGAPLMGLVGDIALARETLEREAAEQGVSISDHFTHLVVHGFLHILGYDHRDEDEALVMEGLETKILARLGVADPYGAEHT